jgi:tRNA pseudouridine(38-40) synthase
VETFAEQTQRELWDNDPFSVAKSVVDNVIGQHHQHQHQQHQQQQHRLIYKMSTTKTNNSPSRYGDMFDGLYVDQYHFEAPRPPNQNDYQKDKLRHYCLRVAYHGDAFCGWQIQPNNSQQPSVQGMLEECIGNVFYTCSSSVGQKKSLGSSHIEVAGRTDAGVSAIGQVCRFRIRRHDLTSETIHKSLNTAISNGPVNTSLRVTHVAEVTRAFHPSFTTSCRAYCYLIDVPGTGFWSAGEGLHQKVSVLSTLLQELEDNDLDYVGVSYGRVKTQDTICRLYHARACLVETQQPKQQTNSASAICIELVGNRFLRRMVRMLVETSMRLTVDNYINQPESENKITTQQQSVQNDALLRLIQQADRSLCGTAPPNGLIFVSALLNG